MVARVGLHKQAVLPVCYGALYERREPWPQEPLLVSRPADDAAPWPCLVVPLFVMSLVTLAFVHAL